MMFANRSTRRITAWLSMLVLVLNALMPLAAQAMLAPDGPDEAVEICTSTGMVRMAVDAQDGSDKPDSAQMQDCPFCQLHAGQTMLPSKPPGLPLPLLHAEMPPAFYQAAQTSPVWLTALSRGPHALLH